MSMRWHEQPSDSPFIKSIWRHVTLSDGSYTTKADGSLDLVIIKEAGQTRLLLSGPTTRSRIIRYRQGSEAIGIRLQPGVYAPALPSQNILDVDDFLPNAGKVRFWLEGSALPFPTFENAETFIATLIKRGLFACDPLVADVLAGRTPGASLRTIQRRFLAVTGLNSYYLLQIRRAEQAVQLLEQGQPLTHVAHETGYTDQSHMTHALKHFIGHTPGRIRELAHLKPNP